MGHDPAPDVVAHQILADDDRSREVPGDLGQQGVAVGGRGRDVGQHEGADVGLGGDLADFRRQGVIARQVGPPGLGSAALDNRHVAVDEDLVEQQIGAPRGVDQGVTAPGVAGDHQALARRLADETEGMAHRAVIDPERGQGQAVEVEDRLGRVAGLDFLDLDIKGGGRGPLLMGDALLQLALPHRHGAVDEGAGAGRADDPLGPVAALVPARHHQLEEVDQVSMAEQKGTTSAV